MAFGKKPPEPVVLEQMEKNRVNKVVHRTEAKILRTFDLHTPIGKAQLLGDTERAMSGRTTVCPHCELPRTGDFTLERTGLCSVCTQVLS